MKNRLEYQNPPDPEQDAGRLHVRILIRLAIAISMLLTVYYLASLYIQKNSHH